MSSKQKKVGSYDLKIINIGFPRCGTSSLSSALDILGFGPTWHLETNNPFYSNKHYKWFNDKLYSIKNGEYFDFDEFFESTGIKCAMDAPFMAIWKELSTFYPNAKIIVCVRDDYQKWKSSLTNAIRWLFDSKMLSIIALMLPFITMARKECFKILYHEWIEQLSTKQKYKERIQEIRDHINDDKRLLILNISQISWEPLCKFLDVDIPKIPYPRNNWKGKMMNRANVAVIQMFIGFILLPVALAIVFYNYYQ